MDVNFKKYKKLSITYEDILSSFIDFAYIKNILPFQYKIMYNKKKIRKLINENIKLLIVCGIDHILNYKNEIKTFSIKELTCDNNLKIFEKIKTKLNNELSEESKMTSIIFDVIENSKNLSVKDCDVIKEFLLTIIVILEKIKMILS